MMPAEKLRKTCFVIMAFGKKTDFATGRTLDLDKTYKNIIKPAVEEAGLKCLRADEIVHAGVIDVPMYEQLLMADVVIADISTANSNVMYQLGVRHTMRPFTTIVIAEDKFYAVPFDVTTLNIRRYAHLGEGIEFDEVIRFRNILTAAILELTSGDFPATPDSPVYMYLPELIPPTMPGDAAVDSVKSAARAGDAAPINDSLSKRLREAEDAQKKGEFLTAKRVLTYVREAMKTEDPHIIQQLALVTYKSKYPTVQAALEEARELLKTLAPETSNDTETLGLWGAVHKRLWELTEDAQYLDEAVRGYERGFYLRNDYYSGINLAYLLNVRSTVASARADAIADFVQAERIRRNVLLICEAELNNEDLPEGEKYWLLATMAEAYLGVGDEAHARQKLKEADSIAFASWMKDTTQEQMEKLRGLLANSPLKSL
jgi:hypothetical protein